MNRQNYAEKGSANAFTEYFYITKSQIESELATFVSNLSHLSLHPKIEYAVLTEGKRFRPMLVILAAESVGGNRKKIMPLALAFELMHTSTLVHDDIVDNDEMRRGRLSLHRKWSVSDAILTGDALIALSVETSAAYGETILKTVAQSALQLCEGENMDLAGSLKATTEEAYFKKIRGKSASLCSAAAYCGAVAAEATVAEAHALSMFGENFGIAYQLRDDMLDFTQNGAINLEESKNGRITLPLIYSYANSTASEKKEIERFLSLVNENPSKAAAKANSILKLVCAKGAFEYCEKQIDMHLSNALGSLLVLKETEYKSYLTEMARTLRNWANIQNPA